MTSWTPTTLNNIPEDELRQYVSEVIRSCADSQKEEPPPMPAKIAQFITAHVLLRLHNVIVEYRKQGVACHGWSKQALLAKVVGTFTGVRLSRADSEYIGNAHDYYLRDYVKKLTKAEKAEARALSRAVKAGRGESTHGCTSQTSDLLKAGNLQMQIWGCPQKHCYLRRRWLTECLPIATQTACSVANRLPCR